MKIFRFIKSLGVDKILMLLIFFIFPLFTIYAQGLFKKPKKSIYALYGHHFQTKYIVDSGQGNLIGRKNVFSAEMGFNLDFTVNKNWMIRTGINGHMLFLNETTYGINGTTPPQLNGWYETYGRGIEYIESNTIGIPVKILYATRMGARFDLALSGGPFIAVYFPASNSMSGSMACIAPGNCIRAYWVTRKFKNHKTNKSLGISYPQLEWDFDVELKSKFKKYGAASLGIKTHIGTRRLEKSTFVIFPDEPNYRSKGHFILNRSYLGVYGAFTFGKNH